MKIIHGISVTPGIAMAVGALVDSVHGLGLVSPRILQEGLKAIKAMLSVQDYPEVVIVCDTLSIGTSLRIPGVHAVGIAAESEFRSPDMDIAVPCVVGLNDLLRSVGDGDIVIVDGGKGIVCIDPDVETVVHYQRMQERGVPERVVYVSAEHIPARTASGETVSVYAYVSCRSDLEEALNQGADGIILDSAYWESGSYERVVEVLQTAAGKSMVFLAAGDISDVLRAATHFAVPDQVTVAFPFEDYEQRLEYAESELELAVAEALVEDLRPPKVLFGVHLTGANAQICLPQQLDVVLVDLRQVASEVYDQFVMSWNRASQVCRSGAKTIIMLGRFVDMIPTVFHAGARAVAVEPQLVAAAKTAVREIDVEPNQFT